MLSASEARDEILELADQVGTEHVLEELVIRLSSADAREELEHLKEIFMIGKYNVE